MKKHSIAVILCCISIILLLTSCRQEEEEKVLLDRNKDSEIQIGLTVDTFVLERWVRERDVFVSTAQNLNAKVDVQNANGNVEKQKQQIEKFIEEKMDAIVVIAVDCYALEEEVTKARNQGIEVISYDRLIQGVQSDLYVTVDNDLVGREMAKEIKKELPDGGQYADRRRIPIVWM